LGTIRRKSPEYSSTGVVLSGKTQEKISYCQDCLNVGVLSKLKHRIYLDENGRITSPAPDADKWKQCWECGAIVGVYEAKLEADIETLTEPRDNPFKFGNTEVRTEESRKFDRTGKTQRKKKLKQDLSQHKEEDIKAALRKGSTLVSYVEN
jgi:hypothetical protein